MKKDLSKYKAENYKVSNCCNGAECDKLGWLNKICYGQVDLYDMGVDPDSLDDISIHYCEGHWDSGKYKKM